MSTRTRRTRVFAAATLAAAALTLTACQNGAGVHDEGASAISASKPASKASGATSTGSGRTEQAAGTSKGSTNRARGSSGTTGAKGSSGQQNSSGSTGAKGAEPTRTRCSTASTRMTATEVSRPLNHVLLTVTNTGSKSCDLIGYPAVRFGEAQSVPPAIEESKPQAVVTLAPGASGYASVLLSAADGSGSNGYTAKTLEVYVNNGRTAARPSLPAKGVHVDDSIRVSYWQQTMTDALAW
jgi:hypothetical protein